MAVMTFEGVPRLLEKNLKVIVKNKIPFRKRCTHINSEWHMSDDVK